MNTRRLNSALRSGRIAAEHREPELERAYERLIRGAGRQAASALEATTVTLTAAANLEPPDWQPPPEGVLLEPAALADLAAARVRKLHARIVRQVAGGALARAGVAWDITQPLSQALLDAAGQRTGKRLAQGAGDVIRETVAGAYAEGLAVRDAAALIRAKVGEAAKGQAEMLARTDLNSLANGGSVMAAQMVGAETKTWLTAEDDRVREMHVEADGQTVPVDQPFDVCGEALDYPGDPAGSDECVCNCRCTVIYGEEIAETASAAPLKSGAIMELARIPSRGFAAAAMPAMAPTAADAPAGAAWVSDLAFEGAATEDGRYILPDALSWRDLPLSLGAMYDTPHADMVMAAPVCGRIDQMALEATSMDGDQLPAGMRAVRAYGVFDMAGDDGTTVARMVGDETMRGVSVDLAVDDWCFRDPESGDLIEPDDASDAEMERAFFGELQYAVRAGTIMAATVCPTPAFADARIALVASGGQRVLRLWAPLRMDGEALTASAAGLAPAKPPADWFTMPEAAKPTPLTVTTEGQVYGHMALWDSCHLGFPGQCIPPPRSPSDYAYFNLGEVECADGSRVSCGTLTLEGLHADVRGRSYSPDPVREHYENTATVAAFVKAKDGRHGIWIAGALRADLSERHARDLMAAKPSGDWQPVRPGGANEMLGVHAVNRPGFPVPRLVASGLPNEAHLKTIAADVYAEAEPARIPALGFAAAR